MLLYAEKSLAREQLTLFAIAIFCPGFDRSEPVRRDDCSNRRFGRSWNGLNALSESTRRSCADRTLRIANFVL